jgi:prepilin-type N-terminal cleavage/methylation domain-containing protein
MLNCEKGFTLIEIISVLVILSVVTAVGFKRFDDFSRSAKAKVLYQALSELNSRELLFWTIVKISDQGWVSDEALFAQLDKNLDGGYRWSSGPTSAGGTLELQSATLSLSRTASTGSAAGKWAAN